MPNAAREQRSAAWVMPEEKILFPIDVPYLHLASQEQFGQPWLQPGTLLQPAQCGRRKQRIETFSNTTGVNRGHKLAQLIGREHERTIRFGG